MSTPLANHFELRGQFCGFIRTLLGKRRLVLRMGDEEHFLKVEKALRHRLKHSLMPGTEILVSGHARSGDGKREVSNVHILTPEGPVACATCPIRVCTKKTCWRNGGKELWDALENTIAQHGLADEVQIEGVNCLDHCKRGPNAEWQGHDFHHCTTRDAERIVAQATGKD
ncbi:MAG TPA: (2Fe-2S) ferredoxin domain-containing protein [Chthoniobacter sp.]|nr:(2Fe-2S) ferredoxin domain-containing protein [Chthoniobacter sp.]